MKIFTVAAGAVKQSAEVTALTLASGVKIPAVTVGEEGRGRKLGVLPVTLLPTSKALWDYQNRAEIKNVRIGETRSGRPKLIETEADESDYAVVVMATPAGFRGSNKHGGRIMWELHASIWSFAWGGDLKSVKGRFLSDILAHPVTPEIYAEYSKAYPHAPSVQSGRLADFVSDVSEIIVDGELPGQILASGAIAQGAAGRAGGGDQYIVLLPKNSTWAIKMTGRLYGKPASYEYYYDGETITPFTARDLELMD